MKKIYIILSSLLVIFLFSGTIQAQNLYISGENELSSSKDINEDWEIILYSSIGNQSSSDITSKVKIHVEEMTTGHNYAICWGINCLPSTSDFDWDKSDEFVINANSITSMGTFSAHYYCTDYVSDPIPGKGVLVFTFYNVNNPDDNCTLKGTFIFTDGGSVSETYSIPSVNVNYTNDNILSVSAENSDNYQLSIFDLNGVQVANANFSTSYSGNFNNLQKGVYFYTILDSQGKFAAKGKILTEK